MNLQEYLNYKIGNHLIKNNKNATLWHFFYIKPYKYLKMIYLYNKIRLMGELQVKRLIQKAYSNNLNGKYIDSAVAMNIIEITDHECTPSKIHNDVNNMEAFWGAVDDTGRYILEIYLYDCTLVQKAGFVYDTIVNGQPSGNLQCLIVKEVNGAAQAKREAINGLSGMDADTITFSKGYQSIEEALAAQPEQPEQSNMQVASSLRSKLRNI